MQQPEASISERLLQVLASMTRDIAHAVRSLARARAFTAVCVLSLGIGMGAIVALATFSRALTAPARGVDTEGLTELLVLPRGPLRAKAGVWAMERWSYPDFQALRDADTGMELAGSAMEFSQFGSRSADDQAPPRVATLYVSPNYFSTFGVSLERGPGFDPAIDDVPSADPRVVLSYDFWKSRLAADPEILGKPVIIGGLPHTVVGIAAAEFRGHFHTFQAPSSLVFVPLEQHPRLREHPELRRDRTVDWVRVHGRLRPGVGIEGANGLVAAVAAGLAVQYPDTNQHKAAIVEPYASMGAAERPESRRIFAVLFTLAGAVLLIVCLNISGMMLVRAAGRERELCIRAALGAGRRRLVQHLFFEAVILAFAGGALSAFVLFGIPAIIAWRLGGPVPPEIDLDAVGIVISTGLCLVVSVLFGLLPAVRFSRPDLNPGLKDEAGAGGRQTIRVHRFAAMAQIAIAIPFLVISGVMIDRVRTADFGFDTDGLAVARLPAPEDGDSDYAARVRRIRDALQEAGGVRAVAVADGAPIDFDYRLFRVARPQEPTFVTSQLTHVDENFLPTIGVPILRGRAITAADRVMEAPVAVISAALAEGLFPDAEPVGERVVVAREGSREEELTIVGVSADFATSQLTTERPQLLVPLQDREASPLSLVVRGAAGDEPQLKAALESALRELGVEAQPGVAFRGVVTGLEMAEKSKADLVAEGTAVGVAGGIVLLLAALGIVGVVAFMVATRQREIAVRMALGSTRLRVFRLMLSDTVKMIVPGVAGGLLLASVLIRSMDSVMGTPLTLGPAPLGVMEPVIYGVAAAVAVAVALLAGLPAARRAAAIQPMAAMRSE